MGRSFELKAFSHGAVREQEVQAAGHLPGISRKVRNTFFMPVELFEHHHGNVNVVFLKSEKRRRIVQQHIGVEDICAGRFRGNGNRFGAGFGSHGVGEVADTTYRGQNWDFDEKELKNP